MDDMLFCFLSCKKNNKIWENLLNLKINSIIFYGDSNIDEPFIYKNRILTLKCDDTYDYLPVKIYLMIKAILQIKEFKSIKYIFKIDDWDTKVSNNINDKLKNVKLSDYCGQNIHKKGGNRMWHFNKCPVDSYWHNKSMEIIKNENLEINDIYKNHIYEDVMIALLLKKNNILPKLIKRVIKGDK